jgi:hypothetical protein
MVQHRYINIAEYNARLKHYIDHRTDEDVFEGITSRIAALHDHVLYTDKPDQREMIRLLCGFNTIAGEIANESGFYNAAQRYHEHAITLAAEKKQYNLEVYARWRRAADFVARGAYIPALQDLQRASKLYKHVSPQMQGYIQVLTARALARTAQAEDQLGSALKLMDMSEMYIGQSAEINMFSLQFDKERYALDRAMVLISSRVKKLLKANEALQLLETNGPKQEKESGHVSLHRLFCSTIIQARAYIGQKDYAFATELAQDLLHTSEEMHTSIHIFDLMILYQALKNSSYGNSLAVARLGVGIMKMQHAETFN